MSQENAEVIRAVYDGWLTGDPGYERLDPEIAMVESKSLPGAVEAYGIEAVSRYIESFAKRLQGSSPRRSVGLPGRPILIPEGRTNRPRLAHKSSSPSPSRAGFGDDALVRRS